MTPPPSAYHVARVGDTVFIRSAGLANMKNAPMLDAFLGAEIEQGARTACIDLSTCTGMDSTFMGLMVGYARQLETQKGRLVIVNPTAANLRLLEMLGVTMVVPVLAEEPAPEVEFVTLASDPGMSPLQRMELIQKAHQNLVKLTEANEAKFAAFLTALNRDLDKLRGK